MASGNSKEKESQAEVPTNQKQVMHPWCTLDAPWRKPRPLQGNKETWHSQHASNDCTPFVYIKEMAEGGSNLPTAQ